MSTYSIRIFEILTHQCKNKNRYESKIRNSLNPDLFLFYTKKERDLEKQAKLHFVVSKSIALICQNSSLISFPSFFQCTSGKASLNFKPP